MIFNVLGELYYRKVQCVHLRCHPTVPLFQQRSETAVTTIAALRAVST